MCFLATPDQITVTQEIDSAETSQCSALTGPLFRRTAEVFVVVHHMAVSDCYRLRADKRKC